MKHTQTRNRHWPTLFQSLKVGDKFKWDRLYGCNCTLVKANDNPLPLVSEYKVDKKDPYCVMLLRHSDSRLLMPCFNNEIVVKI